MSSRPLKVSSRQQSLSIHSYFKSAREQFEDDLPASKIPRIETIQESLRVDPLKKKKKKPRREELNEENAVSTFQRDPGLHRQISEYPLKERNDIRRAYLKLGPYQPDLGDEYPYTKSGIQNRAFQFKWFSSFPGLEYSPMNDRAYCFYCFLFPTKPTFNMNGFSSWKRVFGKQCAFLHHVGGPCSTHHSAVSSCAQLMDPSKDISHLFVAQSKVEVSKEQSNESVHSRTVDSHP